MKYFFDRCMSIKLCKMVAMWESGKHDVVHHDDDGRFDENTKDVEWISSLSRDKIAPIVVSGDTKILKKQDEVAALRESGLTVLCLVSQWPELAIDEMVWKFFKVWPAMRKKSRVKEPTVFKVSAGKSLKVEPLGPTKDLMR